MKARRVRLFARVIAGTAGTTLLATFIVLFVVCREPRLQGRPTTAWVRDLTGAEDGVRDAAMQLFRTEGEKAVPGLVSAMNQRRSTFAFWLERLPFYDLMPGGIKDWVQERTPMQELDRVWAIRMCALVGADARGSHRALQRVLADQSPFVRGAAARALAQTEADPATALPLIGALLSDPDPGARSQAAIALGMYRESARPMLAKLAGLTNDLDRKVAFSAHLAVAMIERPERVTATTNDTGEISFRLER